MVSLGYQSYTHTDWAILTLGLQNNASLHSANTIIKRKLTVYVNAVNTMKNVFLIKIVTAIIVF